VNYFEEIIHPGNPRYESACERARSDEELRDYLKRHRIIINKESSLDWYRNSRMESSEGQ